MIKILLFLILTLGVNANAFISKQETVEIGTKNDLRNGGFEQFLMGWSRYQDAAQATPVDGTAGTPSSNFTLNPSAIATPIFGVAMATWTKNANNAQGYGFSYDFTIDAGDKGIRKQLSFSYQQTSGTYADSDMTIWLYDVTNSRLISLDDNRLLKCVTNNICNYASAFQTSIDSTSYRLIIHTASTSASAYTINFDGFKIAATDRIFAEYKQSYGQSFNNGVLAIVNFDTKVTDTHNAVTTGASWAFTAPAAGIYEACAYIFFGANANTSTDVYDFLLASTSSSKYIARNTITLTGSYFPQQMGGCTKFNLKAGETIQAATQPAFASGTTRTLYTDAVFNHISILRIGI